VKKISIVFHDAGGGHRAAALALQAVIKQLGLPYEVELVHFQEVVLRLDVLHKLTGVRIQEFYNHILRRGWTLGGEQLLWALQTVIRLWSRPLVKLLTAYWREHPADLLLSVIPHFNLQLGRSWGAACPGKPFVTLITDFADLPPRFWIQPGIRQHVIAGTQKAVEQARELGVPEQDISRVSGMVLKPLFYGTQDAKAVLRRELKLRPDMRTALVMFGGYGSKEMLRIARKVNREALHRELPLQLILVCGRNEALAKKLKKMKWRHAPAVVGFTSEVPKLMKAADFFIGKPGPGSLAEALACGLPVLVERNAWTLPQEDYNTDWILENEVGLVLENFNQVLAGVRQMLMPANLAKFQRNIRKLNNQAIFEVPRILARLLGP
jgi:hypothetical protein